MSQRIIECHTTIIAAVDAAALIGCVVTEGTIDDLNRSASDAESSGMVVDAAAEISGGVTAENAIDECGFVISITQSASLMS